MLIHGIQIRYFIQLPFLTALSLIDEQISWMPAPGQTHPQKARPRTRPTMNRRKKIIKLPPITPCLAPIMMRIGER
jgi:hypothetical protein